MSTLTVGQKIRKARRDLDMTQEDLAKKLNTTKATINRYELGVVTNIPRSKLQKIAEVLGVDPEDFFDYTVTLNTLRQQLENIDSELHILESEMQLYHTNDKRFVDAHKKYDSLLVKRERVKADIYRLEALIERERRAEEQSQSEPETEAETETETLETLVNKPRYAGGGPSAYIEGDTLIIPDNLSAVSAEEQELLRIYNSLPVRSRMKLLDMAFSLEDQEK